MFVVSLNQLERDATAEQRRKLERDPSYVVAFKKWVRVCLGYESYEDQLEEDTLPDPAEPAVTKAEAEELMKRLAKAAVLLNLRLRDLHVRRRDS